jgi:hypothetical protein
MAHSARYWLRSGTSVTEIIIATVLLSTAAAGVTRFISHAGTGLQGLEQRHAMMRELENARAIIGSWPIDEVTAEKIEQIPFSASVQPASSTIQWQAQVKRIDVPLAALQITLAIQTVRQQQSSIPVKLTFWLPYTAENQARLPLPAVADETLADESGEPHVSK